MKHRPNVGDWVYCTDTLQKGINLGIHRELPNYYCLLINKTQEKIIRRVNSKTRAIIWSVRILDDVPSKPSFLLFDKQFAYIYCELKYIELIEKKYTL